MEAALANTDIDTDHLRFEVTGLGGGDWDVVVDAGRVLVDLSGRVSASAGRIRIASKWLAAAIDGRVTWRQLLRSLRYSLTRAPGREEDPLLDLLERTSLSTVAGIAPGSDRR